MGNYPPKHIHRYHSKEVHLIFSVANDSMPWSNVVLQGRILMFQFMILR